jgi:hypothetical protein
LSTKILGDGARASCLCFCLSFPSFSKGNLLGFCVCFCFRRESAVSDMAHKYRDSSRSNAGAQNDVICFPHTHVAIRGKLTGRITERNVILIASEESLYFFCAQISLYDWLAPNRRSHPSTQHLRRKLCSCVSFCHSRRESACCHAAPRRSPLGLYPPDAPATMYAAQTISRFPARMAEQKSNGEHIPCL